MKQEGKTDPPAAVRRDSRIRLNNPKELITPFTRDILGCPFTNEGDSSHPDRASGRGYLEGACPCLSGNCPFQNLTPEFSGGMKWTANDWTRSTCQLCLVSSLCSAALPLDLSDPHPPFLSPALPGPPPGQTFPNCVFREDRNFNWLFNCNGFKYPRPPRHSS